MTTNTNIIGNEQFARVMETIQQGKKDRAKSMDVVVLDAVIDVNDNTVDWPEVYKTHILAALSKTGKAPENLTDSQKRVAIALESPKRGRKLIQTLEKVKKEYTKTTIGKDGGTDKFSKVDAEWSSVSLEVVAKGVDKDKDEKPKALIASVVESRGMVTPMMYKARKLKDLLTAAEKCVGEMEKIDNDFDADPFDVNAQIAAANDLLANL